MPLKLWYVQMDVLNDLFGASKAYGEICRCHLLFCLQGGHSANIGSTKSINTLPRVTSCNKPTAGGLAECWFCDLEQQRMINGRPVLDFVTHDVWISWK